MVRKIDTIKRLRFFGDILMLGTFLMLTWVFISAYLNKNYSTKVNINNYGEAHIEMVVLVFFLLPLFLITAALSFIDWRQTWKAKETIRNPRYLLAAPTLSNAIAETSLTCPQCSARFIVENLNVNGTVQCPACGVMGQVAPSRKDYKFKEDSGPNVRIIKNIR